jgi:hypothetical protein
MQALLGMKKIVIDDLKRAYAGQDNPAGWKH